MQNLKKESNTTSASGRPADNYPTDGRTAEPAASDSAKDSSRYSHPDRRPDKNGPGGEV